MTMHLSSIQRHLQTLGREKLLHALRPGLERRTIEAMLVEAGLPPDGFLMELYGWRDGTSSQGYLLGDLYLFPGFYLLSLEDAISNLRSFRNDPRWSPKWLPVFADGGGDFYVIDYSGESTAPVRHFRLEEMHHPIEYPTLGKLIETLAVAFDRGVFFVDDEGYLEVDDPAFATVAAEINPDVDWWVAEI